VFAMGAATRIYVAAGATDMRKSFNGLEGLVRERLECDPTSGHIFLFANARRNRTTFNIPISDVCGRVLLASASREAGPRGSLHNT
jgi:transposase